MHELKYQIINFFGLAAILFFVLKKTVIDSVAKRHKDIKALIEEAKNQKIEAERKLSELDSKISSLEFETKAMLSRAEGDAQDMKRKIIESAKASAAKIVKDAEVSAVAAVQDQRNEIKNEVVKKAVELAEKIIKDKLSSDDQKRILNEYVGKVL